MTTTVINENNNEKMSIITKITAEGRKAGQHIIITVSDPI